MPTPDYLGTITADGLGNVWFNGPYQIVRYNTCAVATPKILTAKPTVEIGERVTLRAEGCSSTIWSWSSADGIGPAQLIVNSNELVANPLSNTTYRARCASDLCGTTSPEATLTLTVLPRLSIAKANKTTYCPGDLLTATIGLQGRVQALNQYSLLARSGGQTTRYTATGNDSTLAITLSATLKPGQYVLYAESSLPVVRSRDSVLITVAPVPTAELSSSKSGLIPGDSTLISVALTGSPPWTFTRWDQQNVQALTSPYTASFKAMEQPAAYRLTVSGLKDAFCPVGMVKNELTINLIPLAAEPASTLGIAVYPNPTSGKLIIDAAGPTRLNRLHLQNAQGRTMKEVYFLVPTHRADWDVTDMPAGVYLLHIETTEHKEGIWKLIKL